LFLLANEEAREHFGVLRRQTGRPSKIAAG